MRTQAAVLYGTGEPLRIEELEVLPLEKGQVLVAMSYSGVCHSQLNEIRGRRGKDPWLPHVLGHEGSGVVEAVGPDVAKVQPGDKVVLTWITGSGRASAPVHYRHALTGETINSGPVSAFGRHVVVSEQKVVRLDAALPMDAAALLGCALPTGAGAVRNTLHAKPEDVLVILGLGGVGLSALLGARLAGVQRIVAVDVIDEKLALARSLGASETLHAGRTDVRQAILEATGGRGADCALDAAGVTETMELGLGLIRKGGTFAIAGNLPQGGTIRIDPFELIAGKRLVGTWGGETDPDRDIPFYAACIEAGELPAAKLISHRFALGDINAAFDLLERGAVSRALLDLAL